MKKIFYRLIAFLVRDVRSFFSSSSDNEQPLTPIPFPLGEQIAQSTTDVSDDTTETAQFAPLPLLLNPAALDRVAFRREIRDWRDNSILQLRLASIEALDEFSIHVETLLDDVPFWRRAMPESTNEVLMADFNSRVRLTIRDEAEKHNNYLNGIMIKWERNKDSRLRLIDKWPDSELSVVANFGFKPSNRTDILNTIYSFVLGSHGIADGFFQQIIDISERMTGEESF